ncbi:MAG TPA: DUF1376 domain-containing protein, partial [Cellvibrionaceae bacterium]|nr:DUF1376 domain-containing protein [Cellvibrionaceae bacterium]
MAKRDKPDVFMPLFVGDYMAGTSRLTTEQHGAYLLLMMDYWVNGPLPNDDAILANITRLSADAWSIAKASIKHLFHEENGCLRHKRIDAELARATENMAKASGKAKKAAEARWKNAPSNAPSIPQALPEQCPLPSPLPPDKKDITNSDELVSAPPKKQKRVTQKNLNAHTPDDELDFSSWPDRPSEQVWTDYKKMRSAKRAWITQTIVAHLGRVLLDLANSGYPVDQIFTIATMRNWTGLEAHWVLNNYSVNAHGPPPQQFLNSRERNAIRSAK